MSSFENQIKKILSKDIELNYTYENMIKNTLMNLKEEKHKYRKNFVKLIVAGCGCLIITTSLVFAKDITNYFKYFFNNNAGMDKAISNGYIMESEMEYVSSGNTEIKIENLLMDDYNLNFTLNIKFDKNIDITKISRIELPKMLITDESNKILYCNNEEEFYSYSQSKNLDYAYNEFNENYINSGINLYIKEINYTENTLKLVCNLYGNNYPKSKKLNISLKQITALNNQESKSIKTNFEGLWDINIDIPSKFYERTSMIYKVKSCSNSKINITKAEITDINMKLELVIQNDKIYESGDSQEVINKKIEKANENAIQEVQEKIKNKDYDNVGLFYAKPYVETDTKEKFYPTESTSEDSGHSNDYMTGIVRYWQTFNLTKQEATKNLKVYLKYNGEDVFIELER